MPDNQMTESEIMKALEICSQNDTNKHYMMTYHGMPLHILFEATLDLINRKNAEIEEKTKRLREVLPIVQEIRTEARAEARAEAIKEFIERATEIFLDAKYIADDTHYARGCNAVIDYCINELHQIAKEMGVEL